MDQDLRTDIQKGLVVAEGNRRTIAWVQRQDPEEEPESTITTTCKKMEITSQTIQTKQPQV